MRIFLAIVVVLLVGAVLAAQPHGLNKDANFFPISVWLNNPIYNAAAYSAANFTVFIVDEWVYPISQEMISTLRSNGMVVVGNPPNSVALNSANADVVQAWFSVDEPDNAQPLDSGGWGACISPATVKTTYDNYKAQDPLKRPVFLNFGQAVANPGWFGRGDYCTGHTSDYPEYGKGLDIASFDVYPRNEGYPLEQVAIGMNNLKSWIPNKPIWCYVETTKYQASSPAGPTPDDTEYMVWSAIIHGAHGINYFCHVFEPSFAEAGCLQDPNMRTRLGLVNGRLKDLAPVLNSPDFAGVTVTSSAGASVPIDLLAKVVGSNLYIFAQTMRGSSSTGTFTIPTSLYPAATATLIYEGRTVSISSRRFSDSFSGYKTHIYKIALSTAPPATTTVAPTTPPVTTTKAATTSPQTTTARPSTAPPGTTTKAPTTSPQPTTSRPTTTPPLTTTRAPTTPPQSTTPKPTVFSGYLGCYRDNMTTSALRDLPRKLWSDSNNTVSRCVRACQARNYSYAGLQWARECWCGNRYGRYGAASAADCNMHCTGNASQICGGSLRNSVYKVPGGVVRADSSSGSVGGGHSHLSSAVVAVIVVGAVIAAVALAVIVFVALKKRRALESSHSLKKQLLDQ